MSIRSLSSFSLITLSSKQTFPEKRIFLSFCSTRCRVGWENIYQSRLLNLPAVPVQPRSAETSQPLRLSQSECEEISNKLTAPLLLKLVQLNVPDHPDSKRSKRELGYSLDRKSVV